MEKSESTVIIDATAKFYDKGYVRVPQYISENDPRYNAGNNMENRVEPPPPEILGDVFDRQRVIEHFNQGAIETQRCMLMGVGGIGQNVAILLARLGVGEIVFVDNDTYDASNLTRQLLGSIGDVGKTKVEIVRENLKFHNIRSNLKGHHMDVLSNWTDVVAAARNSTVLFNCIDIGTMYDFAVNSLSKHLEIPLIQAQSAGWSFNVEFYSGQPGTTCWACDNSIKSAFALAGQNLNAIISRLSNFILKEQLQEQHLNIQQIFTFLSTDPQYLVSGDTTWRIIAKSIDNLYSLSILPLLSDSNREQTVPLANFSDFLNQYYLESFHLLLPQNIATLPDLMFIPRPKHVPTRFVGSWVCPAMGAATNMVSKFTNFVTGPTERDPLTSTLFNFATDTTDLCDMALMCGMVCPPSKSSDSSSPACLVCKSVFNRLQEKLYFSTSQKISLSKTNGKFIPFAETTTCLSSQLEVRNGLLWRNIDGLGTEYSSLVLDAVPCRDYQDLPCESDEANIVEMKERFNSPLIKCPKGSGDVEGYPSGLRSALLPVIGEANRTGYDWFRLKGCGMPNVGFTVVDVLDDLNQVVLNPQTNLPLRKIRGACYPHTSNVEAQMSYLLSKKLASVGLTCGNTPIGRWDFSSNSLGSVDGSSGLHKNDPEYPLVTRSAGLFRTLGDRRLGDHVLRGLELLLSQLLVETSSDHELLIQSTLKALQGTGLAEMGTLREESDFLRPSLNDEELLINRVINIECWDEYDGKLTKAMLLYGGGANTNPTSFVNLPQCSPLTGLSLPDPNRTLPSNVSPCLLLLWQHYCNELLRHCPSESRDSWIGTLFGKLYFELGRDCGLVSRVLYENDVVWGAFRDASGGHMNAHSNNFILLPEQFEFRSDEANSMALPVNRHFLAPIDFDMAYSRSNCCFGEDVDGTHSDWNEQFDSYRESERSELGFNLAMTQASQPSTNSGTKPPIVLSPTLSLVRLALRDTLVAGWLKEVQSSPSSSPPSSISEISANDRHCCYCLLNLALILTSDVIA